MVIPITHQSQVKNRDFNHSPITISNGDSNHSPITNQITLHNFLGSNFDYYISNKYLFSIITVVQSACQSIVFGHQASVEMQEMALTVKFRG